jgi:hypothetical protein
MDTASTEIAEFWNLFRRRAVDLTASVSTDSPAYNALLDHLHRIDPGLYLEFCANPGACEMIVTADGDRSLFSLARAVVAAAPVIDGWTIRALKPQIGCPETTQCEGLTLRLADITFDPLEFEGSSELGLRIYVPGIEEKDIDAAHNALLRALDHTLGEEKFAESVQYTEVLPLPENAAREQFIHISDLDAFIRWRQGRRQVD